MGHKYFISYSRSVKEEVRRLIELLEANKHEVWWDSDIQPGHTWWANILDKIEWCDIFICVVSEKSIESIFCMEEIRYATARNRILIPFIIDSYPVDKLPTEITPKLNQCLSYQGDLEDSVRQILLSSAQFDKRNFPDRKAQRPPKPGGGHGSLTDQFVQAVTLAENGHFDQSLAEFRQVESLDRSEWAKECDEWINKINEYRQIAKYTEHRATLSKARNAWTQYKTRYLDDDKTVFDPLKIEEKFSVIVGSSSENAIKKIKTSTTESDPLTEAVLRSLEKGSQLDFYIGMSVKHPKFGKGIIRAISHDGEMLSIKFDAVGVKHLLTEAANLSIDYKIGQAVSHSKFGKGIITAISRDGEMLSVKFDAVGVKHLMAEVTRLTLL